MTKVVRLTLVSHAMTDAMTAARFPDDESLNETGRRQAEATGALAISGPRARHVAAPELRARQTARLLGLHAATEPLLADLDCGHWRGKTLAAVDPADLQVWLTRPDRAPHGGESVVELIERVGGWLASTLHGPPRTVAVTHPAVIRAAILLALDIAPKSFWRIDVAPAGVTKLHHRDGSWTLRLG
ncbi:histidine phosphatase family protein [Mycobacterium sherrisii]|uniref:Histidine phosphatase n=1 Tax=Mycobacterium sherrisii TaxID=243061 RepID=A0A1E3SU86_9MYCO|nr:histidine phosphatase family protein [Mycobacterium sherrisii]MCV7029153.1 histidine phosphatase family protein [Mycobacterium sherrisii]MEC4763266.1 histidine phosphatase family protein [Mycobacterium sherrisii]ODR05727.1 histidine phosphatase [Mycobacterium sherrisii]ORW77010.1 histidine phosphatase [Mycobacterium sherrisii]